MEGLWCDRSGTAPLTKGMFVCRPPSTLYNKYLSRKHWMARMAVCMEKIKSRKKILIKNRTRKGNINRKGERVCKQVSTKTRILYYIGWL